MDIEFFNNTKNLYIENNASDSMWLDFYECMFKDISLVKPEDLIEEHTAFMKDCEEFFSSIDVFEKANILNQLQAAANEIFKARERINEIMKRYGKI